MKAPLALVVMGLLALFAKGVAALFVPTYWIPDLGLLLVVAGAIGLRSTATGVLIAALLGYATDCLSGSLLGQHMLLSIGAFAAARVAASQLNLRGPIPQATFVLVLAAVHAGLGEGRLYVGSWSEWCSDPERPVATGPEPGTLPPE